MLDEIEGLSPEEQTAWRKAHMPDWDRFVEDIRINRERLAAHEALGASGYLPGWSYPDEYREQRRLTRHPARSSSTLAQPTERRGV